MAELSIPSHGNGKRGMVRRAKKLSTRVDLTPMVDLGFLLITFFMVTTTWQRAKAMNLYLPADGIEINVAESVTLTLIPLKDNQVLYYEGRLLDAIQNHRFGVSNYSENTGIGNIIRQKQFMLDRNPRFKEGRKEMIVIIKPVSEANLQNVVKALDEMVINDVKRYSLVDIEEPEKEFLKKQGLFH